jgi:hypothetical protein
MAASSDKQKLRDQFFQKLAEATLPLQKNPDPEVALESLIDASQLLTEHLRRQLEELRQEQAE